LERATELGRVLVSQDDDLLREGVRCLKEHKAFSGVIYSHQLRITIGQMVDDLELIATARFAQIEIGCDTCKRPTALPIDSSDRGNGTC
jgi:hypothetical protein